MFYLLSPSARRPRSQQLEDRREEFVPAVDSLTIACLSRTDAWLNYLVASEIEHKQVLTCQKALWGSVARASLDQYFMHLESDPRVDRLRKNPLGAHLDQR